jgi:hypothetical protein
MPYRNPVPAPANQPEREGGGNTAPKRGEKHGSKRAERIPESSRFPRSEKSWRPVLVKSESGALAPKLEKSETGATRIKQDKA